MASSMNSEKNLSSLYKFSWTNCNTRHLIEVWRDHYRDLTSPKRKTIVYQKMAIEFSTSLELEVPLTGVQIQIKINNLRKQFRREKQNIGPSGSSPSKWWAYNIIASIVGRAPLNNSLVSQSQDFIASDLVEISRSSENEKEPSNRIVRIEDNVKLQLLDESLDENESEVINAISVATTSNQSQSQKRPATDEENGSLSKKKKIELNSNHNEPPAVSTEQDSLLDVSPSLITSKESSTDIACACSNIATSVAPPISTKKKCRMDVANDVFLNVNEYFKRQTENKTDDKHDVFGKNVAHKLRDMDKMQRVLVEKIINDALFEAEMGTLTRRHKLVSVGYNACKKGRYN